MKLSSKERNTYRKRKQEMRKTEREKERSSEKLLSIVSTRPLRHRMVNQRILWPRAIGHFLHSPKNSARRKYGLNTKV